MTRTRSPFALAVDAYLVTYCATIYCEPGGVRERVCARVGKPASWFSRVVRSVDRGSCPVRVLAEFLDALRAVGEEREKLILSAIPPRG